MQVLKNGFSTIFRYRASLLICLGASMANGDSSAVYDFDPFVVESTRLQKSWMEVSQSVSLFGEADIQQANQQITLDESLQGTPGIFILNPYNYAQDTRISIRGFGARADFGIRGIKLIIDGIPATTPDGQGEVDGMDLGSASRIEVLRGPSAAYYGAASGGVIRVSTESGPADPFMETRVTLGDEALRHWQFKGGGQSGSLNYLISGGHLTSDGYRGNSETENTRLNGRIDYQVADDQRVKLVFNVIDFPLQNDAGGLTREEAIANPRQARARNLQYDAGESVTQERIGLAYERDLGETHSVIARVFHTHRDFSNRLPFESGGQVTYERIFNGARMAYAFNGRTSRFSAGIDLDRQDDDRRNYDNMDGSRGNLVVDQNEEVSSAAAFLIYEQQLSEKLLISSAIRYDDVEFVVSDRLLDDGDDSGKVTFTELSPTAGAILSITDEAILYANVSRSFETPTTTEFDNPDGGGFNLELESQHALNLELGSRGSFQSGGVDFMFDVAFFQLDITDALVPYELPEFPGREFFRNAGESTRRGVETSLQARLGRNFVIGIDYTWSDFAYDTFLVDATDYSGNRLPGIPQHFGNITVRYDSGEGFFANWKTLFVGSFYANDANSEQISRYSVSDFRAGYLLRTGAWELEPFLGVLNIFDQRYFANIRLNAFGGRHFEPAPMRNYFAGMRVRYDF